MFVMVKLMAREIRSKHSKRHVRINESSTPTIVSEAYSYKDLSEALVWCSMVSGNPLVLIPTHFV